MNAGALVTSLLFRSGNQGRLSLGNVFLCSHPSRPDCFIPPAQICRPRGIFPLFPDTVIRFAIPDHHVQQHSTEYTQRMPYE